MDIESKRARSGYLTEFNPAHPGFTGYQSKLGSHCPQCGTSFSMMFKHIQLKVKKSKYHEIDWLEILNG